MLGLKLNEFDKKIIDDGVFQAVSKTFADMFFIDVQTIENAETVEIKSSNIFYNRINSPFIGSIRLYLPIECKKQLIENIMNYI